MRSYDYKILTRLPKSHFATMTRPETEPSDFDWAAVEVELHELIEAGWEIESTTTAPAGHMGHGAGWLYPAITIVLRRPVTSE